MVRRKLEEFELGAVVGQGTVGTIYEATDLSNGQKVAVKVLLPTVCSDEVVAARFAREMLILEKLSHPHILRYHGGGRSGSQLFFVTELLSGGSVKDELARGGPFAWVQAATCGAQVCGALQHAHNHGIIHRDLKPSNLLFDDQGNLKLVDFGIARDTREADLTSQGLTVGSYAYMSPEQIAGERSITGQADLYSFGCLLFELLTGRPPFVGESFPQLFKQHLTAPPPSVRTLAPETPPEMDQLIQELLAKRPEDRPFNARTVQGRLLQMLDGQFRQEGEAADRPAAEVIDQGRQAVLERLQSQPRDISWVALGGLAVAASLLAWAAWYFGV